MWEAPADTLSYFQQSWPLMIFTAVQHFFMAPDVTTKATVLHQMSEQ
jgi:hypothetical protein